MSSSLTAWRTSRFAEKVASALELQDISVWWDLQTIPVGVDWAEFLIGQVSEAVCAIVLWSSHSVESKWVLREAEIALRRRVLIPVLIESIPIPDAFVRIQTANLADWNGDRNDPGFQNLIKSVRHFIERLLRPPPKKPELTNNHNAPPNAVPRNFTSKTFAANPRSSMSISKIPPFTIN